MSVRTYAQPEQPSLLLQKKWVTRCRSAWFPAAHRARQVQACYLYPCQKSRTCDWWTFVHSCMRCQKLLLQTAEYGSAAGRQDSKQPPNEYTVTEAVDYIGGIDIALKHRHFVCTVNPCNLHVLRLRICLFQFSTIMSGPATVFAASLIAPLGVPLTAPLMQSLLHPLL